MTIKSCVLCPRSCNAKRENYKGNGFCKTGSSPVVARVAPHLWEEPCISGAKGSGAVFFSGCIMKCVYCQNYSISAENKGKVITPKSLAECYKRLEQQGVHNINLVNPTHFTYSIIESLDIYKPNIPVVYNCGGYEKTETLKKLNGYVDIYLPDFKYAFDDIAVKYSSAPNYTDIAKAAIKEMISQQQNLIFDKNGILQKGVIVRHLVLPGNTKNSIEVLKILKNEFGNNIYVSLMAQYIPCGKANKYSEINRKITKREYNKVLNMLIDLDMQGFAQDMESASRDYIPDFNFQGIDELAAD